jgi:hypothetical protein
MILLSDLLKTRGFNFNSSFKLIRHKPPDHPIEKLIDNDLFEQYNCIHHIDRYDCDYVIVFVGKESSKALFWGIYKVIDKIKASKANLTEEYKKEFPLDNFNEKFYYILEKQRNYEDLEKRIIIDWGKGTRAWIQKKCDKEIIEIKPKGFVDDFPGYLDFVLPFKKLEQIINNPDANSVWKNKLSSVYGIYLILDKKTGKQYIGSAYGENGIWGRWKKYIKTGHGNNYLLMELMSNNENYKDNFQFTILQTLPSNLESDEVINYEILYKEKLGSKVFGLNKN